MTDTNEIKNPERIELLLKGLRNGDFPATLFKYRGMKRAKQILTDFKFRFSSPAEFNDPFDCSLDEILQYDRSEIENWINNMLSSAVLNNDSMLTQGSDNTELLNYFLKDKEKLMSIIYEAKTKVINSRGVFALSKKVDDILLWSHYAESQSGVAIELELKEDPSFFLMPRNMEYVDSYTPTNYLTDSLGTVDKILSTKFSGWKYEDEMRIYKDNSADKDIVINPKAIKAVYFGIKAKSKDIQSIKELCQVSQLQHVNFFQGEKIYGQFKIKFMPI